jgi:hypothetical protein
MKKRERNPWTEEQQETGWRRKGLNTRLLIGFRRMKAQLKRVGDAVYEGEFLLVKRKVNNRVGKYL